MQAPTTEHIFSDEKLSANKHTHTKLSKEEEKEEVTLVHRNSIGILSAEKLGCKESILAKLAKTTPRWQERDEEKIGSTSSSHSILLWLLPLQHVLPTDRKGERLRVGSASFQTVQHHQLCQRRQLPLAEKQPFPCIFIGHRLRTIKLHMCTASNGQWEGRLKNDDLLPESSTSGSRPADRNEKKGKDSQEISETQSQL